MKILTIVSLYILIIIAILQNWLWLAGLLVLLFSLQFGAAALVPAAILIDGYFGNFYTWPYLSFAAIAWYVFIDYIRPKVLNPSLVNKSIWQN
jgi:hypothetical protein